MERRYGGSMINAEELAVCKQRGHHSDIGLRSGWVQCKWCGMWLREIRTMQEREDDPPMSERNSLVELRQKLDNMSGEAENL